MSEQSDPKQDKLWEDEVKDKDKELSQKYDRSVKVAKEEADKAAAQKGKGEEPKKK